MSRYKKESKATFELRVNQDGYLLLSIFFRPTGMWQYVEYWRDGSISSKVDLTSDQFMEIIEKIRTEREAKSAEGRG